MDTGILDVAAYSREAMRLDIHELMNPQLRKPIRECNLKFPHKCQLNGGQMTGSWDLSRQVSQVNYQFARYLRDRHAWWEEWRNTPSS